ncbi:MAG: response regulator [Melioribacteraceae bacterium]
MTYKYKLDFFEKLTNLYELASGGASSFPNEVSLFILRELEIKSVVLLDEVTKKSKGNNFTVIGRTASADRAYDFGETFTLKDYPHVIEEQKFNNTFVTNCKINSPSKDEELQSVAFGYDNNSTGIILLSHKILPPNKELNKYFSIVEISSQLLTAWKNAGGIVKSSSSLNFTDVVFKSSQGYKKIANSINGFANLIEDESISEKTSKLIKQIKESNQFLLNSIHDMMELTKFEQENFVLNKSKTDIQVLIDTVIDNHKNNVGADVSFDIEKQISESVEIDRDIFTNIIQSLLSTTCMISEDKNVTISSKLSSSNKIFFSCRTYVPQIHSSHIMDFKDPFVVTDLIEKSYPSISGLTLTLLKKYVEYINGTFKISIDKEDIIKFSVIVKSNSKLKEQYTNEQIQQLLDNKNKVLVIESDESTSILLKKNLSKWNYQTEFVNSGNKALKQLKKNKYVSIILNIDQEKENSLKILQQIKNSSTSRNVPVIIFSIEPKTEQIYLMGSLEYLVKPIDYNNLVEILTSYKLRQDSNVLCVDDDKPTLNLVEQAIKTAGFNAIVEHRSELVIDSIKKTNLELALIDLDMPNVNGVELIKQIKSIQNFENLPIIIYTGKEDYQEDLESIEGLFVDLLEKRSTSLNELEKTITDMISSNDKTSNKNGQNSDSDYPRILMAEDYKHSQIIVTRLLKKNGFENITVVENGKEALDICEKEKVDIILMDMQMPVMNGFEATGKIRELDGYEDTPIIALTAFAMKGDREKCLEAGATDYIAKPIDSKEFIEKVKYYSQQKVES